MKRSKGDTGDVSYLISRSQQEVVEEDGGCRELIILVMGVT